MSNSKRTRWISPIVVLAFALYASTILAQHGLEFHELKRRLLPYFAEEMIWDIQKQLPQRESYRIWGWDVGDFSGDQYPDVALSIKRAGQKQRLAEVLLFVDIDGFLVEVGRFLKPYVQLPIEVGVAIKDSTCYIVNRQSQTRWEITGYRFRNGILFTTMHLRSEEHKHHIYRYRQDYHQLSIQQQWFNRRTGQQFRHTLTTITPVYRRFRILPAGLPQMPTISSVNFVPKGAYYWYGEQDAYFRIKAAYNQHSLYILLDVHDDTVIAERQPHSLADRAALWIDTRSLQQVSADAPIIVDPTTPSSDSGLIVLELFLGDFARLKPSIRIQSTEPLDSLQRAALDQLRIVTRPTKYGYQIKVRIPFQLLGFFAPPLRNDAFTLLRIATTVYDVDNRFRPEEETLLVNSTNFDPFNSSTYGVFCLIPDQQQYGSFRNIYIDPLLSRLSELGF